LWIFLISGNERDWITNTHEAEIEYILNNCIKCFSTRLARITGPDGGFPHSWICKNSKCEEYHRLIEYNDK
jgi:hypothetical protein